MFRKFLFVFVLAVLISIVPFVALAQGPSFSGTINPAEITVFSGAPVTFTLTVANTSEDDSQQVYAQNTFLPSELALMTNTIASSSGIFTPTTVGGSTVIDWAGPIANGGVVTITYQVTSMVKAGQSALNTLFVGDARGGPGSTLVGTIGTGGTFVPDPGTEARVNGPVTIYLPVVFKNYSAP